MLLLLRCRCASARLWAPLPALSCRRFFLVVLLLLLRAGNCLTCAKARCGPAALSLVCQALPVAEYASTKSNTYFVTYRQMIAVSVEQPYWCPAASPHDACLHLHFLLLPSLLRLRVCRDATPAAACSHLPSGP